MEKFKSLFIITNSKQKNKYLIYYKFLNKCFIGKLKAKLKNVYRLDILFTANLYRLPYYIFKYDIHINLDNNCKSFLINKMNINDMVPLHKPN